MYEYCLPYVANAVVNEVDVVVFISLYEPSDCLIYSSYAVAPATALQDNLNVPFAFTVAFIVGVCNFLLFVALTVLLKSDVLLPTAFILYAYCLPYVANAVVNEVAVVVFITLYVPSDCLIYKSYLLAPATLFHDNVNVPFAFTVALSVGAASCISL
ncbi:hypothetical protein IMSAG250_00418 [Clostridiales bacterium]|nr:hypothetical protein IMSAG250_00418 [Clostridiales bacterium]